MARPGCLQLQRAFREMQAVLYKQKLIFPGIGALVLLSEYQEFFGKWVIWEGCIEEGKSGNAVLQKKLGAGLCSGQMGLGFPYNICSSKTGHQFSHSSSPASMLL